MGTIANLRVEDMQVFYKEIDLGFTLGGVELSYEREFVDLTADQYGNTPLDKVLSGQSLKIKCMLAEPTKANLAKSIPEGAYSIAGGDDKLGLGAEAGYRLRDDAGLLRLHPRRLAGSDTNEDIYIWLAVSTAAINQAYKVDEQRVLEVEFEALVDPSQPARTKLGQVGNSAIS